MAAQSVDPGASKAKFGREVREFRKLAGDYGRKGWFLAEASFPTAFVVLAVPQLQPPALLTGVLFDYTDYDVSPPSVHLVDPFSREPYPAERLPTQLFRQSTQTFALPIQVPEGLQAPTMIVPQPLMQAHPGGMPFLCIAGVREYHEHPGHSGDAWELHRTAGAGRLVRILDVLDTYGIRPISGYNVATVHQVQGFGQQDIPA